MADTKFSDLRIEYQSVSSLKPIAHNARTHSKKQLHQIAASIREFGFTNPVLIDRSNTIIAGHGRIDAAKILGLDQVPTIQIEHLSEAQKRAYVIADNKLADNAGWDPDILAIEFQHLSSIDVNFELEITGFDTAEIDLLVDGAHKPDAIGDRIPPTGGPPVTQRGDLWLLGDHRIICGDARDAAVFEQLMAGDTARLAFTDPPYNVPIDGHVCGLGLVKHREFAMASGEMTAREFTAFLHTIFMNAAEVSADGAIHFICMDWRHVEEVMRAGKGAYSELKNICVWNKDNGGMGSFYRSKHELVFVLKVGNAPHLNTIELGRSGRYRTNVWDYAGVNSMRAGRLDDLAMHPTVKPVALVIDAIKDCSRRDDLVLDPFGGSGTTLIAAEKSRRRARLIEIDPAYVDVAIRRWQKLTGGSATHGASGHTFSDVAKDQPLQPLQSNRGHKYEGI